MSVVTVLDPVVDAELVADELTELDAVDETVLEAVDVNEELPVLEGELEAVVVAVVAVLLALVDAVDDADVVNVLETDELYVEPTVDVAEVVSRHFLTHVLVTIGIRSFENQL